MVRKPVWIPLGCNVPYFLRFSDFGYNFKKTLKLFYL